jgi:hypothetical protein
LVPLAAIQFHALLKVALTLTLGAVTSQEIDFIVLSAGLLHLLDGRMRLEFSLCALLQLAMNSLVVGIPVCKQAAG